MELKLTIDGETYTAQADSGQTAVKIQIDIEKGTKIVQPVFVDKDDNPITAPYYGYVTRIRQRK